MGVGPGARKKIGPPQSDDILYVGFFLLVFGKVGEGVSSPTPVAPDAPVCNIV